MAFLTTLLLITLFTTANAAESIGGILGGILSCANASVAVARTYDVIPDAKVDFVCGTGNGTSIVEVIQSTQTNITGVYNFVISSLDAILINGGKCYLNVTLPPNSCILNLPTSVGVLRIPVFVLSTIDVLVGKILVLVPGALNFLLPSSYIIS